MGYLCIFLYRFRSLQHTPSVRETHPAESLRNLSRTARGEDRIANRSAGGELQMLGSRRQEGGPGKENTTRDSLTATTRTRSQEVSQLIKEAKQAASGVRP